MFTTCVVLSTEILGEEGNSSIQSIDLSIMNAPLSVYSKPLRKLFTKLKFIKCRFVCIIFFAKMCRERGVRVVIHFCLIFPRNQKRN